MRPDGVVVSTESLASSDPYEVIQSNIEFINELRERYVRTAEIAPDALRSYYADYFYAQIQNGGFSQFVYNSRLEPATLGYVQEGLAAMGSVEWRELLEEALEALGELDPDVVAKLFASDYFGDNQARDIVEALGEEFFDLEEDLIALNAKWLRGLPNLVALTKEAMHAELARREAAIPDLAERKAEALAAEPRFMKLARAWCAESGEDFVRVNGGDPSHQYQGRELVAWYFRTSKAVRCLVELEGRGVVFDGETKQPLGEVPG